MRGSSVFVVASVFAAGGSAFGQSGWTVEFLEAPGSTNTSATGIAGTTVTGTARFSDMPHAGYWSFRDREFVDLNPPTAEKSRAAATDGVQQVGEAFRNAYWRASLWSGTAESWVDLSPRVGRPIASKAIGVRGGKQVGYVDFGRGVEAAMWSGTAESFVSLHPAGAEWSISFDIDGLQQVGYVRYLEVSRACVWTGNAETWVDLSPWFADESMVYGIGDGEQGGFARFEMNLRAAMWRGTAESWVDLHPVAAMNSEVRDVAAGYQVGFATLPYDQHAFVWQGDASTAFDLHTLLPSTFRESYASAAWSDGTRIYVSGFARDTETRAVVWSKELSAEGCRADFNRDGFLDFFDYADFAMCFEGEWCPPQTSPDFNRDGFVDFFDYSEFVTAFESGC